MTTYPAQPIKLYRNPISGHCHRVELMLSLLGLPYETIDLDMANGAHKEADYLRISPLGQVPSIEDNGYTLTDSNAILVYLINTYAPDSHWLPKVPKSAAELQRWFSIAAGEIAYGPCAVRLVKVFGVPLDYDVAAQITLKLFAVMEDHLTNQKYLVDNSLTAADIACYSYVSHVPEGGVSLEPYPAIQKWLTHIEEEPGFVAMEKSDLPELMINA